jgi:type IV pilus assembly protein PilO
MALTLKMDVAQLKQGKTMHVGVGVLAVVLIAGAYYLLLYSDISDQIDKQQRQSQSLRSELAQQKQAEVAYQKDLAELNERKQHQRELNLILPETTEHPAFLSSLQNVANVSGVTLLGWTPQEEVSQRFYAKVPMKLVLSGRYHQIAKFVHGVGQLDRIINVENIALSNPKPVGDEVVLKVDCLATAFHSIPLKQGAPLPAEKKK